MEFISASGLHSVDTLSMYPSSLGITRRKQKKSSASKKNYIRDNRNGQSIDESFPECFRTVSETGWRIDIKVLYATL